MPGAGKSTIGVLLAKAIGYPFIDTDLLIQEQENKLLQTMINESGIEGFLEIEETLISNLNIDKSVIATGGSVVYSEKGMDHLKNIGQILYLKLPFSIIEQRLDNITTRGVAMKKGQNLYKLYEERCPLYEKYADKIIEGEGLSVEEIIEQIIKVI
jgi:shikimate kinase